MRRGRNVAPLLSGKSITAASLASLLSLGLATEARALEPLGEFLASAKTRAFDTQEARALLAQRSSDNDQAWYELLPTVTGTAGYQYNQYKVVAELPTGDAVFTPKNQLEATIAAELPLIDVATWARMKSSARSEDAARAQVSAREFDVQRATARAYFSVVATEAVVLTAQRSLEVAIKNKERSQARFEAGVAPELDVKRADAEVERNRQLVAEANYQVAVARRELETLSGKTPSPGAPTLASNLEPEAGLESFRGGSDTLPSVRAAEQDAKAAEAIHGAARSALLPTVKATFNERFTNAAGFGPKYYYNIGISASIKLDATLPAAARGQGHAVEAARIRAARARRDAEDDIYNAWHDVQRQIEKSRAARAQVEASKLAAEMTRDRYEAGTATILDLVSAERDVLSAEVERIRADADLNHARVALRLYAGKAPREEGTP